MIDSQAFHHPSHQISSIEKIGFTEKFITHNSYYLYIPEVLTKPKMAICQLCGRENEFALNMCHFVNYWYSESEWFK